MQTSLFHHLKPVDAPTLLSGFALRDYQSEDADAVSREWDAGNLHVLCVHATGLGKSVMAAELAKRKPAGSRALVVVDSTDLAMDLHRTIKKHTGIQPGILTGDYKETLTSQIIVATKQCLCAGDRYREFNTVGLDRLIIDECEAALANEYLLMISHFVEQNPQLKICGMTATPLPAGNRAISDLFPHAASQPGPLYRDLQWAYLNGWLVKPMQGVLRCSLDFASLKVRKQENGEKDYSDKDIAKLMLQQDERQWLELAGGIYQIAKGHTAIVVCPNSTMVADKLAGYIEGFGRDDGHRGVAHSIHRSLGKRASYDILKRFKAGEFPIAVSVRMFEKGFDYDRVNMVIVVRRTKSLRLYTQIAGRGTRPLQGIRGALANEQDAKQRMQIIATSQKPSCVIVDCVGVDDDAKDILGVIDILGRGVRDDIKERVRRMMLDRARKQQAGQPLGVDQQPGMDVGDDARKAIVDEREDLERERRAALSAKVDVSYRLDNARASRERRVEPLGKPHRGNSSAAQVRLLIALGTSPLVALAYGKRQAGAVISSLKQKETVADWSNLKRWEREHGKVE